jgi:cytochrome c
MSRLVALTALALLSACSKAPEGEEATGEQVATEAPAEALAENPGKVTFNRCAACHNIEKGGPNGIGPNLHGIVGRNVASADGFIYSDAMKAKGGVWDEAGLDAYIAEPIKAVPGNKMIFAGIPDAAQRKALIEYLKTLK